MSNKRSIIDFSTHLTSKRVIKEVTEIRARLGTNRPFNFDPITAEMGERLRVMDKYGINIQVMSFNSNSLIGLPPEDANRIGRMANDDVAELCRKRPDRFIGLAHVTLTDVKDALTELERGVRELGFRGVILPTNENGVGIDSPQFDPLYKRISEYDIPILLHPTNWKDYPLANGPFMGMFGWPFDTTQAMWRLKSNGVLKKYPNLKIVAHHLGAMLPFFYGRLEEYLWRTGVNVPQSEFWKQIYGDTAISGGLPEAYMLGYSFFGADRMVYGSDYPFGQDNGEGFISKNLDPVIKMPVSEEDREKILFETAKKLLKIS
ncbi:MAG: amidohydrolase family protein [Nitrososphaerales archaeon]